MTEVSLNVMKKVQTLNTPKSQSRLSRSPIEAYVKEQVIKGFSNLTFEGQGNVLIILQSSSESGVTFLIMDPINAELSSSAGRGKVESKW